jgi:putative membrane protein
LKHSGEQGTIQQHLANERTYLAWMRTAIAIMGVGFVTTSLHFELTSYTNEKADTLIRCIGYASLGLGMVSLVTSTWAYLHKRKGINEQTFRSSSWGLVLIAVGLIAVAFTFGLYLYEAY